MVAAIDPAVDAQLKAELDASVAALDALRQAVADGLAYDQMLARGNEKGEALIMAAVDSLITQTRSIERAVTVLDLGDVAVEASDSLDNPGAVFQQQGHRPWPQGMSIGGWRG